MALNQRISTLDDYVHKVENVIANKAPFAEHFFGSRRSLIVGGKVRAIYQYNGALDIGELSKDKFVHFLAAFMKHLYSNLRNSETLLLLKINFEKSSRKKNNLFWDDLQEGTVFFNIDLKRAYWQMLHRIGYISTEFYDKYNYDLYKKALRYCVSLLARRNYVNYYDEGGKQRTIQSDYATLKNVYDNVRKELYICVSKALDVCNNEYIEYNIDGISILPSKINEVKEVFNDLGLDYKITQCVKTSNFGYIHNVSNKNFTINRSYAKNI